MRVNAVKKRANQDLSDYELVKQLQNPGSQKELLLSQSELYYRYAPYLYKCGITRLGPFPGADALSVELVQRTFIIAFQKIDSFRFKESATEDNFHYLIKSWLGRTANNVYKQMLDKKEANFCSGLTEREEDIMDMTGVDEGQGSGSTEESHYHCLIREALASLTDKQHEVLVAYANEDCILSGRHISNDTMAYLCSKYRATPANIRQLKKRALDKVKSQLASPIKNSNHESKQNTGKRIRSIRSHDPEIAAHR